MTSLDVVRQLKEIAVEITEMSAEELEEIWPWANGLADAVDALRVGRKLKTYEETGGHSAGGEAPPLPDVPDAPGQWRPEAAVDTDGRI